jgi:hypothetical protein
MTKILELTLLLEVVDIKICHDEASVLLNSEIVPFLHHSRIENNNFLRRLKVSYESLATYEKQTMKESLGLFRL